MVLNPGISNSNDVEPQVEIYGDGMYSTRLLMTADTGFGSCAFGEGDRSQHSMSRSLYRGFRLLGPGSAPYGATPAGMDGLCIGEKARVQRVLASGFHAGFNLMRDHQMLENVEGSGDYFGIEFAANSDTFGNQHFVADSFSGLLASIAIAWNGSFEYSMFDNVSVGFTPYSFYREAAPLGSSSSLSMLAGCNFNGVYAESVGNAFIYGENGAADTIVSNSWIGVSPTLDPSGNYRLAGRPVPAVVLCGQLVPEHADRVGFWQWHELRPRCRRDLRDREQHPGQQMDRSDLLDEPDPQRHQADLQDGHDVVRHLRDGSGGG